MIQKKKKNIWDLAQFDVDTYVQMKFYQIIYSILKTNRDKNSKSTLQDEIALFIIFFFFFFFLNILIRYFQSFRNVSRTKSSKNITYFGIKYQLLIFPV